jgi:hypothetical protein
MYHEEGLGYLERLKEELRDTCWQVEFLLANPIPKMFHQEVPFNFLVQISYPLIRGWLDMMAALVQAEAIDVQQQFREARADFQKEQRKGRAWKHDVRVKNTPNGIAVEWLSYTGKYGEQHFSEGIRSGGLKRVPARNFQPCSLVEKKAISVAEDHFSRLRQATMWLSTLAKAQTALVQMHPLDVSDKPECEVDLLE